MKYNVLITGSDGFIGKNLYHTIKNNININKIYSFSRKNTEADLVTYIEKSDLIFHFAATNRSESDNDFAENNENLTKFICNQLRKSSREKKIVFTSSIHSGNDSIYGKTKLNAELEIKKLQEVLNIKQVIYRLPGIYGKWAKPNYNSVVATFCFNILNDIPIKINDEKTKISLVYIDDLIEEFIKHIELPLNISSQVNIHKDVISIGELSRLIKNFSDTFKINDLHDSFQKKLLSTYQSYKNPDQLSYKLNENTDNRGSFTEILNTQYSGQFSFLTSRPGITRGNHFHNTKFEKFIVVSGNASFKFRDLNTGKCFTKITSSAIPEVVETSPGWVHDITNTGKDDLIVLAWANENFDLAKPDTIFEVV